MIVSITRARCPVPASPPMRGPTTARSCHVTGRTTFALVSPSAGDYCGYGLQPRA